LTKNVNIFLILFFARSASGRSAANKYTADREQRTAKPETAHSAEQTGDGKTADSERDQRQPAPDL
jgi:hypothetical protein